MAASDNLLMKSRYGLLDESAKSDRRHQGKLASKAAAPFESTALSASRLDFVTRPGLLHLQRTAGNAAVNALLPAAKRSPVVEQADNASPVTGDGSSKNTIALSKGKSLLADELSPVMEQLGATTNGGSEVIQRKELSPAEIRGKQDWTFFDRKFQTQRWKDACLTNLNAVDSSQYVKVVERRDFYKWFYEYTASLGYHTRWALAAYVVATGAHLIADMDAVHETSNDALKLANVELQGAMREGNQVIFDNVLPKLKRLLDGGPLTGQAALDWDKKILAEEQTLIQPMYSKMSKETIEQLDYIARKKRFAGWGASLTDEDKIPASPGNKGGTTPEFDQSSLKNIGDRWTYGMNLGNTFTPGGTGFEPNKDTMPEVGSGYKDGSELAKVDTHANLHELDAWLNPDRLSRTGSGSDIQMIINKLSDFEKKQVLADHSPDGWAYSRQFAQFDFITEAMVLNAVPVPSTVALQVAVSSFLARYKAERKQVESKYPVPTPDAIPF
jgi:hypothetical protein